MSCTLNLQYLSNIGYICMHKNSSLSSHMRKKIHVIKKRAFFLYPAKTSFKIQSITSHIEYPNLLSKFNSSIHFPRYIADQFKWLSSSLLLIPVTRSRIRRRAMCSSIPTTPNKLAIFPSPTLEISGCISLLVQRARLMGILT